jgi:hypothetical protein
VKGSSIARYYASISLIAAQDSGGIVPTIQPSPVDHSSAVIDAGVVVSPRRETAGVRHDVIGRNAVFAGEDTAVTCKGNRSIVADGRSLSVNRAFDTAAVNRCQRTAGNFCSCSAVAFEDFRTACIQSGKKCHFFAVIEGQSLPETAVLAVGAGNYGVIGGSALTDKNILPAGVQIPEKGYLSFFVKGKSLTEIAKLGIDIRGNRLVASAGIDK